MYYYELKFTLDFDDNEYSNIQDIFNKAKPLLNWHFDENLNPFPIDDDINYQIRDISNLKETDLEEINSHFFGFKFENIVNTPLYRFLVLKNNERIKILANISSLIFDYSSIKEFYELFDNSDKSDSESSESNKSHSEYSLDSHYKTLKNYLNSSDFKKDSAYWKNYILDSSNYIKFYNIKENSLKSQTIHVNKDSVLNFINNHDCSLFDFYGSVFSLYLFRVDRLDGCLLKTITPVNNTENSDLSLFDKNTLLKIDINKNNSFNELLNQFTSAYKNSIKHTKTDINNYLDEETTFYSVYDFSELNRNIRIYNGNKSALTLNIYEDYLEIVYNQDLFSDIYINHMAKNIESLISNLINSPDKTIGTINILSDDEKELIREFSKGKTVEVEEDKLFSQALRDYAKRNPDSIAVDDGVNQITYMELEKSTNSIANDLYENHNIGPGSRVALMLPRNYHYVELGVALNKIGAAFIPIDMQFPENRIGHMLSIAQSQHLITVKRVGENLDLDTDIIFLEELKSDNEVDLKILSKQDNLLAIIFTSGTTGVPKGVMYHNRQFPWAAAAFKEMFNFKEGDLVGSYFSFSFVASMIIFVTLYMGGSVRLFNEEEQKNSLLLIKALKEKHMNNLILPPTVGIPIFENEDLNLDYLILAGAKLNKLSKKERHTKIVNFYGTTEIIFAVSKIYDLKDIKDDRVPIGKPVTNTWAHILDENNNQMPVGVAGEICISGGIACQGYFNDAELTSGLFVENPFGENEINRIMYRTGDIGFYNFDGEIEIIGREDNQLSVRGFRVESDEILSIMKGFKEISDIYLDVDNDNLIAYYTTNDNIDISQVKDALKDQLPYYMIPGLFIELEKIPLNINGKIDKFSLKKTLKSDNNIEIADETLRTVVDAFKEVLNLDTVLIDDDFVSLGGNSLSAMQLQLILKEKLDVYLSSNEMMGLSTPREISDYIKFSLSSHSIIDEKKYSFDKTCPLSESQLNVYLDESVNGLETAYNNPFRIDLNENYSVDEIKKALLRLFEVFPILKARIVNEDDRPSFIFNGTPEISEGNLKDIESFVKPFEFSKSLSRYLIVKEEDSLILCADFHHTIFDGSSLNIILSKLDSILKNEDINSVDNGNLRQISLEENIDSEYMDNAHEFFDGMLAYRDEVYDLLPSVKCEKDRDNNVLDDKNEDNEQLVALNHKKEDYEQIDIFDIDISSLNSFIQKHSLTYNQFFTTVFAYTLSRFSGSDKVLFNIVENGRGHIDLSESVGMFVKTLPVLMDCSNRNIDSFLEYSSNLINTVMKYDLYPFRILAKDYDLNSNIIFQYSHNIFADVISKKDLNYTVDELEHDLNADFSFNIFNYGENKLTIRALYSDLYSRDFISGFIESYKLILNEIRMADELKEIDYTSKDDINLLNAYNKTEHPLIYDDILDAFNENLSKNPQKRLVAYENTSYTYGEGAYIADAIAKRLIDLGIENQDRVSFLVHRSEMYIFCVLGIMSIGGIYVPIDDSLPNERVEFMRDDTESRVIIVSDETLERVENLNSECTILNLSEIINGEIKSLDRLDNVYSDFNSDNKLNKAHKDLNSNKKSDNEYNDFNTNNNLNKDNKNLACILYTSGSTGLPKGVKITRSSLVNFIDFHVNSLQILPEDVYGLYASIGFDVAMAAIFSVIYSGACLDIIPNDIKLNIRAMNDHFIEHGVTHSYITTQISKLFIDRIEKTSLKVLVAGGEKLGQIDEERDYRIVDAYGPTEACVYVISADTRDKIDYSSVGHVQNNTKAYILDNEMRRVPIGAVGELYLSGIQLADGYLNREKESSKAFLSNPFEENMEYSGLYRTGDVARILPDGTYGIVGRRDGQVKIRGNRVELLEVESAIRDLDIIEDVTVQTIKIGANHELVAYVVSSEDIENRELENIVCDYINENKPPYMVPSFVIKLDEIPLNVNGKVDKRALPEVDFDSLHAEYLAPRNEDERNIVEAFQKVFNQKIGIHDDFLRLGGDSLTAIKVLSYLEDYNITAVDILSLHTPYAIAKKIKRLEFDLDIYNTEEGCPLNESQLNVYLDILVNGKDDAYLIPLSMEIPKKYGIDEIKDALNRIVDVHPILSMHISDEFEVPYLVKGSDPSVIVENNADDDYIIEFINRPFDLEDSLCRFLIVDDGTNDSSVGNDNNEDKDNNSPDANNNNYTLFASFNHIIFDGLSSNVFKKDLLSILNGETIDKDESFLKVSAFSKEIQKQDDYIRAREFYEAMLTDIDESGVLIESIDGDKQGKVKINLDLDTNQLKPFLDRYGLSENVLFTSSFAYALSRFTGSEYASFNLVENGRDRFNNFDSIGMYVNTLPLLIDCKNQDIKSFLEDVSNLVYDVMRYNYYPFRLLANEYNINSDILFQFLPEWINGESDEETLKTKDNETKTSNTKDDEGKTSNTKEKSLSLNNKDNEILSHRNNMICDFNVEVAEKNENYNLSIMYSNKYSNSFVEHFAQSYKLILQQIITAERLDEISYISDEDIEILDSYNRTEHKAKYDDILDAFNENLSEYENNTLVTYKDKSYTHGQGAFISNEIADRLKSFGIEKQDFVALFVKRSEWFLLASMGVLTMGGIYVPIDASYPSERILLMLNDTESKAVIVDDDSQDYMNDIIRENNLNIDILNVSSIMEDIISNSNKESISSSNHLNAVKVNENDIACVLYTSGTTGTPKGVLVSRKAINNFVSWYVKETEFTDNDIYGMHCSYVFDMHTHALYSPVISGGSLCVVPEDIRLDLKALNDYFVKHSCTHTYITSQVGKLFAESGMETTIRLICFGGMKLGELNAPDSVGPFESYGPSENLAISTSIFANKRSHHSSIGRFISNVKGYVLDSEHRRVPIGAVGELYLSGAQLTPGYLNRDEENGNAFFDNPFDYDNESENKNDATYSRIYATGDIVRFLPDGTLGIVGRRDSQVKIRGNRVELTEVESVIRSMDDIEDITVQLANNNGNNELIAYIVTKGDLKEDPIDHVRQYVSNRKPEYMVPSYVIVLDEIPLNINGKVDKRRLPEVDLDSLHEKYVAPVSEIEKHIVNAFEDALNQKDVGLNDDFVRLGGDSITAIRVISLLEKNDIICSARDILNYKTPYLIAQNIESVEKISYEAVEGEVDLLPIQEYFFSEINRNDFTQNFILKSNEKLDKKLLQESFNELCNVHDMLRANYSFDDDGEVLQEILPVNSTICQINEYDIFDILKESDKEDVSSTNEEKISDHLKDSIKEIFIKSTDSINIENNLIEINLIHHNNESYLMFIIHHLIIDGVSWNILISDLTQIYSNLKMGNETEISRPYPYKNWVEDIKELLNNISHEEKQHWIKVNKLLDDSEIEGDSNPFSFNIDVNYDINNLLILSEEEYWALAIAKAYKKTYGRDIIFNRETHGRDDSIAKVNRTIGWFTSQYPVLVDVNNNDDDVSLVSDVYSIKNAFKEIDNFGLNYSSLIYTDRALEFKHSPVTFNFLSSEFVFKNELFESYMDSSIDYEEITKKDSKTYGITFNVVRNGDSYSISGDYAKNTYIGDEFDRFIENIKAELEFIGNHKFKDNNIICCLSESQLGVYLDEKANEKDSAYSTPGIFECDNSYSIDEIMASINALIKKHPVLRGRILDTDSIPLLICDASPSIEIIRENDSNEIIKDEKSIEIIKENDSNEIIKDEKSIEIIKENDSNEIIKDGDENKNSNKKINGTDKNSNKGIKVEDYSNLIKPFELDKTMARFFIIENDNSRFIFYDMHHIISDATSRTIINRELDEILRGNSEDTIDLGFVYASKDSFESKYGPKYKSAHEFFINSLADIDDVQYFLSDVEGSKGSVSLPIRGIREDVESFAKKNGITVGSLLNSAFAYTYSRFTGSDKVYYNFTEHGRHENYLHDALGMYVRTIPVLVDCKDQQVSEFAENVSDLILKSMENSIYPFRLLAREFDLRNDVVFEYNFDLAEIDINDDMVLREDADSVSEFLCVVNDLEDGFLISLSHLDRFSQDSAKRFVNAFKEILTQLLEKDRLKDINYISSEDIELLDSYNKTDYPLDCNDILDAFNENLKKDPENKLLEFMDRSYSSGEVAYIADAIAKRLVDLGVETNDRVSFLVPRSELYMFSILAVMSLGATYVPLNDKLPDERISFMIKDTESKVLIVSDDTLKRGEELREDCILLNISEIMKDDIGSLDSLAVSYGNLLCILYTSGSTGLPKGVKIRRKSLVNLIDVHIRDMEIHKEDVYGLFTSISFDVSMAGIFSALYCGVCLNIIPEDIKYNIKALNNHFIRYGVTHSSITTQVSKLFINQVKETSLKVLLTLGEKLGHVDEIRDYRIVDAYGPTEACVYVSAIDTEEKIDYSSVGPIQNNTKGYVLDNEYRRVPIGAVGELYLSGCQLADGYLNREEESKKAFLENKFENNDQYNRIDSTKDNEKTIPKEYNRIDSTKDNEKTIPREYNIMYRTGDVARILPDGTYGIIGRRDGQVKIRGNRVELSEIEASIREIDYIEDITVQTVKHDGNNEIVAYAVTNNGLDGDELRDSVCSHVRKHKPDYMVPSYVIKLDEIPLNVNGKVDKRALPDVDMSNLQAEYIAPRNQNERKIVEAFEKALNLDRVSVHDDFIRLGGDSLSAIKLLSFIDSADLTMADIFSYRTPEAIARNMDDLSFDLDIFTLESGYPLNGAQLNVFADVTIYNKRNAYHIPGYIAIPKEYGIEKIVDALEGVIDAHPILGMRLSGEFERNENSTGNMDLIRDLTRTARKFGAKKLLDIAGVYGVSDIKGLYNMLKSTIKLLKGEYPIMVKGSRPSILIESQIDKESVSVESEFDEDSISAESKFNKDHISLESQFDEDSISAESKFNKDHISLESQFDEDTVVDFLGESLDLYKNLSKFMIVETEESYYLIYLIHHIIFDAISAGVFQRDLMVLLDGGSIDYDDTFLRASAFTHHIKSTEKFDEAAEYYEPILTDIEDIGLLKEDSEAEGYNVSIHDMEFDKVGFKSFLKNSEISENVLFTAVFSYTLSQFVEGDRVIFTLIENGRDRFKEDFIGMTSNVMPVVADCRNQTIDSFMKNMADTVYGALRHSYYPILLLYQKYDFEVNILFQFVPNWIADDFTNTDDDETNEIINKVLDGYGDYLTEFFVQIYQNGDNYRMVIVNSNKYSKKMVDEFKDMYISVLSNIIKADRNCELKNL